MSRLPLHALDVDAIHSTLASMSISSPSDIGWSSPHPVAASRRTEAARAESVVSHPALSSVLPPDSSSFLVSPKSPSDGIFARQLNFDNSQQQPISAIQYRSPQASKSASYINAMWREQFQSRGEALGADLAVAPVMPKEPPLQRVDVPSSYALEHRDPRVDSESLERVALERIELELALAIERKNALVSLKRSLSQRIEEHLTQQRQIAERARLDSVAHFESVQEELSIALCSKVLSSANAVFDNSRAQESSSSSSVPNNFAYESLLDRELQRDIETLVVDLKAKVTRELELEMEAELTARMGAEESALRARRKHWADLAKSDAEALHVTKTQEELLRLEAEDGASTSASMERSFVDKLADIRPKDFYDNAKKYVLYACFFH